MHNVTGKLRVLLPITMTSITDKPTPRTKEKLIIAPTKGYAIPTYKLRTTPKDKFTLITSNLVRT